MNVIKDSGKNAVTAKKGLKITDLKDMNELQSYFVRRLEKILEQKGKNLLDGMKSLKEVWLQMPL